MPTFADQMPLPFGADAAPAGNVVLPVRQGLGDPPPPLLAPAPMVDKWPVIIGQGLSLAYLSNVYRLCTQGWRWQWVDAINELLEHDPHARGVFRQRILPLVAAPFKVLPKALPSDAPQADIDLAKKIADDVRLRLDAIPARAQAIGRLAWGIVYGVSSIETRWDKSDGWNVRSLEFVHSRRLNMTNPTSWDLYVYDQGPTSPWAAQNFSLGYGLRIGDFPGKFIVHSPALNGDYATRDGEGRYVGFYLALKRMIVRASAQDFERVIRPWVLGYFNREEKKDRNPVANTADIATLKSAVKSLGMGSLNAAILPDAVRVELLRVASSAGNPREFADWLDNQVTEAALGQTYTTSPGARGNFGATSVAASGTLKLTMYDAQCLCDSLERDLVYWLVALNYDVQTAVKFAPRLQLGVTDPPTPESVAAIAKALTSCDIPLERGKVGEMAGMPVIDESDAEGLATRRTRMVTSSFGSPIEPTATDDPNDANYQPPADADPDADGSAPPAPPPPPPPAVKKKIGKSQLAPAKPVAKGAPRAPVDKEKDGARAMSDRLAVAGSGRFYYNGRERRRAEDALRAITLADRGDRKVAHDVYEQLLDDYPAKALDWILAATWEGPVSIPIDRIDYSTRDQWRASYEPIDQYITRIAGGRMKPMILVRTPGLGPLRIIDGHHRALAYEKLGKPAIGFIATVPVELGPWDELHGMQKKGSSKGTASFMRSWLPSLGGAPSRTAPSRGDAGTSRIPPGARASWIPVKPDRDPTPPPVSATPSPAFAAKDGVPRKS